MKKLFIISRSDLPPGAIAAQSVHGAIAFTVAHPSTFKEWHDDSNNIVLLAVPDERALMYLAARALAADIPVAVYREPDLGDTLTSVAIGPEGRRLVSSLPLALRPTKAA